MIESLEDVDFREEQLFQLLALEGFELDDLDSDDLVWMVGGVLVSSLVPL